MEPHVADWADSPPLPRRGQRSDGPGEWFRGRNVPRRRPAPLTARNATYQSDGRGLGDKEMASILASTPRTVEIHRTKASAALRRTTPRRGDLGSKRGSRESVDQPASPWHQRAELTGATWPAGCPAPNGEVSRATLGYQAFSNSLGRHSEVRVVPAPLTQYRPLG